MRGSTRRGVGPTISRLPRLSAGIAIALASLASCATGGRPDSALAELLAPAPYPPVRFAVVSDPHYFDPSLGTSGPALREYLDNDRKLLADSPELLDAALAIVRSSGATFLLVPGDLTKDGERVSHEGIARRLEALELDGVAVYVVPGNHDVNNPAARRFDASGSHPVASVGAAEFAGVYRQLGYGEALFRHSGSLSYVAQPAPGLWLLAIDSCDYAENEQRGGPETAGLLDAGRRRWIGQMLAEAARRGIAVIAFEHHGVIEHFAGQSGDFHEYLLKRWREDARMFATCGVRVVFTGHFHAQDVTAARWSDGAFLFDVETGSLVTTPNPVRIVEVDSDGRMLIRTVAIRELASYRERGIDFVSYAERFSHDGVATVAASILRRYLVPVRDAERLAPAIADAFVAHLQGDERLPAGETLPSRQLGWWACLVIGTRRATVRGLWTDLPPADNDLLISLVDGPP